MNTKDGSFELKLMKEKDKFYLETGFTTEQVSEYLREHKAKAEMEKQVAEMKEAKKNRKDEEAKAAKLSKIVENSSPGAAVQVGRQVIFLIISMLFMLLFPDLMRCRRRKLR